MTDAMIQKRLTRLEGEVKRLRHTQSSVEKARTQLRAMILQGLEGGPAKKIDAAFWKRMRVLARQHAARA